LLLLFVVGMVVFAVVIVVLLAMPERPVTERMSGTDRQTDTWQATTALVDRC